MATKKTESLEVTMVHDKDTPGTHVFRKEKPDMAMKTAYIDRGFIEPGVKRIKITIEPLD